MTDAPRDGNFVTTALFQIEGGSRSELMPGQIDEVTGRILVDNAGGGSGTVTSVSVVSANGFAGTVANATTTPAITLTTTVTGVLKGNGTAISAAVAATDYVAPGVITSSGLTMPTARLLGRTTAGSGAIEEITVGSGLSLVAGELTATGGSGGITIGTTTITSGTNTRILYNNAGVVGEYTLTGSGTVVAMQTAPSFLTSITTPSVLATANDSGAIGASGTAFSDLFLASGGVINWSTGDVTITHSLNALAFAGATSGYSFDDEILPSANDAAGIGSPTTSWADLFLASGGVIGWNNNDVLITHSANTLAFSGASSGYTFDALVTPSANDGAPLGSGTVSWADLFLASGAVINFNNGNVTITHAAGALTVAGASTVSLGTSAAFTTGTIELGAASDTTISRSAAGQIAVEGVQVVTTSNTVTMTNKTLQHTFEPPTDDTFTGETLQGLNAGATIAQWDCVYLGSASKWLLTDADAASSAGGVMVAMATTSGTDTNPLTVILRGVVRNDGWTWATVGAPLYLDTTTAGGMTLTAPSGTDDVVKVVGYVLSDDCIYFNPSNDWITRV